MPAPQSQVIYLPATRDTTDEGAAMLVHALQQMVASFGEARDRKEREKIRQQQLDRQSMLDAQAAEDRSRRIEAEDIDRQRADEATIAKLAPETSMYEPMQPTPVEIQAADPELGLPAVMQDIQLGPETLRQPMLKEVTLPSGKKLPFRVNPSKESTEAESAAAQAITFPDDENLSPLFRGRTYRPGDAGYGLAKLAYPAILKQLTESPKAPTIDSRTGLGWNPQTKRFDLNVGHSVTPKTEDAGEKLYKLDQFNPETGEAETVFVTESQARKMAAGAAPGVRKGPGTAEKNRMAAARASIEAGEALLADLADPEFSSQIGPVIGRYNSLQAAAGAGDPNAQYLVGALKSFSALQPQIHGFRAVQMADNVEKLLSTKQTPAALAAGLRGILTASYVVAKQRRGASAGGTGAAAGGSTKDLADDFLKSLGQ